MGLLDSLIYREDVSRVASLNLAWDRLAGSRLVLSGASGMIGKFLVDVLMSRNLNQGLDCTIYAIARGRTRMSERFGDYAGHPNLVIVPHDVSTGPIDLDAADYVIHAAANTHPVAYAQDPIGTIMTNVQGTFNLLELAARTQARRALFLSTVEIYGDNRGGESFIESDMGYIDCNTLRAGYPESKRTGEALCQAFIQHHGLDIVIPRLPRVFGPAIKADDTKALSQFLFNAVAGKDIVLKSAGDQFFSYCHLVDAVSAILTCLFDGACGQAYNVADPGCNIKLKDLAQLVASAVGRQVIFNLPGVVEQRGFSAATIAVMNGTKLSKLGWTLLYDLETGIRRTIAVLNDQR